MTQQALASLTPPLEIKKKKILVLISRGGGGHKTAGESLTQTLSPAYDVEICNVISDVLKPLDPLNLITRGRFTGEDLYNFFLRRHQSKLIHWMAIQGARTMRKKRVEKAFEKYLRKHKNPPDLIISTTPFVNWGIACVLQQHGLPFIILPTDLDGSTFLNGFPKDLPHFNPNFKLALAYDDPEIKKITLKDVCIREDQISITGFPIRPDCQKTYSREELSRIRAAFNLREGYKTATLIMGALGGNLILEHTAILTKLDPSLYHLKLQLNICVGENSKIGDKIIQNLLNLQATKVGPSSYELPSGLLFHIHGYTKEIIKLMAASDVIITKTGSCTVNEAIYLGKKLLLDNTPKATARHLWWERFNIPFVQRHKLGLSFIDAEQLLMLLPSILKYPDKKEIILKKPFFEENILRLVKGLI